MRRSRSAVLVGGLLSIAIASLAASAAAEVVPNPDPSLIARWEPCEPGTGVTVIVDRQNRLGDGRIDVGCAPGEQETGLAALHHAGFATAGVGGSDAFVCRIDGQPTPAEDTCAQTPGGCCYWSYWHGKPGGVWGYSGVGAANPLSRAPIDSIEGWGFGGLRPRIYPMDGSGPSSFTLPPPQESSAVPAALAREWLRGAAVGTAVLAQTPGSGVGIDDEEMLTEAIALARAGVGAGDLAPIASLYESPWQSNGVEYSRLLAYANDPGFSFGIDPESPEFPLYGSARGYALAIVALVALGKDPTDFLGHDLRADLIAKIDDASGKIRNEQPGSPVTKSAELFQTAPTVRALALTGALPAKAEMTVDLVLDAQDPTTGAFGSGTSVLAIEALAAARDAGVTGLDQPIEKAAGYLEGLQEGDGGIRAEMEGGPAGLPTLESTAAGAVALALAGRAPAAEKAAKWVSRYQLTAEYVGTPDPVSGEPAPAEPLIGAFLSQEGEMRNAILNGLPAAPGPHGLYSSARLPTAEALEALEAAGPYGPLSSSLSEESLWFGKQTVGTTGPTQTATLTNEDERSLMVGAIALGGGEPGDFVLDGSSCLGRTLAVGESCELAVSFGPTAVGVREALVRVELAGGEQTFELSLGGTGFPAPAVESTLTDDPDPPPPPRPAPTPLAPPGAGSIVGREASRVGGRVVRVASLSCPAGAHCRLTLPARVRLKIAAKRYWAAVLAPASLGPGESAPVRLRLPGRALEALAAASHAVVSLEVEIASEGGTASRTLRTRLTAAHARL
jgi:hypothetical protein